MIASGLKMKVLSNLAKIENSKFISVNLYAKTKLGFTWILAEIKGFLCR